MQIAFDIKPSMTDKVPSAVHVDGTTRVHVVRKSENLLYWELISEFKKLTGVPVLLNTSFNRHGISTISTPRQAVEHLLEGCMDYLAIDDYLVAFEDNRIVADRNEAIESEGILLKIGSVERLKVFKTHGTDSQMTKYLLNLSNLIGVNVELSDNRKIKFLDKVLDIDSAQEIIISVLRDEVCN
jgi:hypothetical protein